MSSDNAIERLRALLDEHGVEHYDHENDEPLRDEVKPDLATSWRMGDASVCAVPDKNGTFDLWIDHATHEQAVAATLGGYENDELRMDVDLMNCRLRACGEERDDLRAENAKLRELVADMWHEGAFSPGACYAEGSSRLEERTRELGIEVG